MVVLQRSLDRSVQRTLQGLLWWLGALLLLAVASGLLASQLLTRQLATVYADRVVPLRDLQRISQLLNVDVPVTLGGGADGALQQQLLNELVREQNALWRKYLATYLTAEESALAETAGQQLGALQTLLGAERPPDAASRYMLQLRPLNTTLSALLDLQVRVADSELNSGRAWGRWASAWGLLLALLGLALMLLAIRLVLTRVLRPLAVVADGIARLSEGELTLSPEAHQLSGDYAEVGDQLRRLRNSVAERQQLLAHEQALGAQLREAQAELVEAEKLASLGALVAGVAHELNTPIGVAVTVSSGLADKVRRFQQDLALGPLKRSMLDGLLASISEADQLLARNLARAAELIRSFKQVAVDRSSAQRRQFDLRETVDELLASLRPAYGRHGTELINELPPGLRMDSYPGALGQVLTNLVVNAVLHGFDGHGGAVRIALADRSEGTLDLMVEDQGRGMSAEVQARAFEPFFTTRLGQGGSGLGLAIVRNLVVGLLGGRIVLHSSEGQGCRFLLHLPLSAPAGAAPEHHASITA